MLKLPDYLQSRTTALKTLTTGLGASLPAHVSLDGDRFTLIDENGLAARTIPPSLTLDFVIVGAAERASRIFWAADSYDRDAASAPVCWSHDALVPDDDAPQKQSETCGMCPQAVWGSKISQASGKGIPACQTRKKIAIIVPAAGAKIYMLSIPPDSLKPWRSYVDYVEINGASLQYIITRAAMEKKQLSFDAVDFVPKEVADAVDELIEKQALEIARVVGDTPQAIALPAPSNTAQSLLTTPPLYPQPSQNETRVVTEKRSRGRPRKEETIIPPGPIQKDRFAGLKPQAEEYRSTRVVAIKPENGEDEEAAMLRRLEEIRAAKAGIKAVESTMTAKQAEESVKTGFIGGGTSFGIASSAPPPPNEVADMLAKAFNLPT